MRARYLTDEEYEEYWDELGGVRSSIARHLAEETPRAILDVGCGWGYYTSHLASGNGQGEVVAIDLVPSAFTNMRRIVGEELPDPILPMLADASRLPVRDCSFDLATSFLGMRDIYMTTSEEGVRSTVEGMIRALRPGGRIALALTPPDLADSEDQSIAIEVEGDVFGAASPPSSFYESIFESNGVELLERPAFYTGGKMTAKQTRVELEDGLRIARSVYNKDVPGFDEVWARYGPSIEGHGYGMYSKITVIIGEKVR